MSKKYFAKPRFTFQQKSFFGYKIRYLSSSVSNSRQRFLALVAVLFVLNLFVPFNNSILHNVRYSDAGFGYQRSSTIEFLSHRINQTGTPDLLRIILIVTPVSNQKLVGGSGYNAQKLTKILQELEHSSYDAPVHLEIIMLPSRNSTEMRTTKNILHSFVWNNGPLTIRESTVGGRMEHIIAQWTPLRDSLGSVALIDSEKVTSIPSNWFNFVQEMQNKFRGRSDIIAFSVEPLKYSKVLNKVQTAYTNLDYFLWEGTVDAAIIIPFSVNTWLTFLNWFQRERGNWYLWPSVIGMKLKKDERWDYFNSTLRATWQHWLTRFCALHHVFILHRTHELGSLGNRDETFNRYPFLSIDSIPQLRLNGSVIQQNDQSRISRETIIKIIDFSHQSGGTVSITFVNEAYLEIAQSWICNVDVGGFRPPGIVWICTDDVAYDTLKKIPNSFAIRARELKGARNGNWYGSSGYWLLMLERAFLVRDLLSSGCSVFLFETDQVWLRDPVPFIRQIVESGEDVDLVGTIDAGNEIGGNFLFLKPSLSMRTVYREVCRRFEKEYRRLRVERIPKEKKVRMVNDQYLLSKLVLYEEPYRSRFPVVFRPLDMELFACGKWYEQGHNRYSTARSRSPIVINNNWVRGIEKKISRLKRHGHWFYEDSKCNASRVQEAIFENEVRGDHGEQINSSASTPKGIRASVVLGNDSIVDFELVLSALTKETGS